MANLLQDYMHKVNQLDPFRDDPDMAVTAPGVTEEHIEKGFEETPPDPEQFCSCGLCSSMATQAESFCCKSVNYLQDGAGCIVNCPLVKDLLKKTILEINLRTERSVRGEVDTREFSNKNYRFSAYRSLFFWLNKKKKCKKFRMALPSCLVTHVRNLYPDETYTGFQPSSPVIRNTRRRNN